MESVSEGYWASSESNNRKSFAYVDNSFDAFTFKAHSCKQDRKNKAALQKKRGDFLNLQQQQSEGGEIRKKTFSSRMHPVGDSGGTP